MRVALVHDYLSQDGGAERVLKAMHEIWPTAPIFVLFHDPQKINYIKKDNIHESFLARLPFIKNHFQWYLTFMPIATEKYRLENFDVIISSTSAFAKGIIVKPHTLHISYCHTPPRYLWNDTHEYFDDLQLNPFVKTILPRLIHKLRLWDQMSANRVDHFIANSRTVQHRIHKYYRRDSDIIFPPVDTEQFYLAEKLGNYFLAGGRLVPYKRLDLVIKVFNRLKWPLKIFGMGPEYKRLKNMAKPNIELLGRVTEEEKKSLMSQALALLHPQIEDLGLTPIESMAAGRPVIAYHEGGAAETVLHQETGILFPQQSWESLLHTLLQFNQEAWDKNKIKNHAESFNTIAFKEKLKQQVEHRYEEFKNGLLQPILIK